MTYKIIEVLKFIRSKALHIFLCLVLLFAFCFKDSVPSAEAMDLEGYWLTEACGEGIEILQAEEAMTAFIEAVPLLTSYSEVPSYIETFADTAESTETEAPAETRGETEAAAPGEETISEETTAEEISAEEIISEEETAFEEETTVEELPETEPAAEEITEEPAPDVTEEFQEPQDQEPEEPSYSISNAYGQRYQEQWEIDYADQLFDLVNAEREKYGLAPLKKMDSLTAAAVERAWEVTIYNSHTRPDGTSCFTVLPEHGLALSKRAENVAYYSQTPQSAFNSLMGNYAHREPMLSSKFEYMGVGFYCVYNDVSGYHYYWTQIFYTP